MLFKKISKVNRLLLIAVAVFISLNYLLPIWKISLVAPQYPEGLSMHIYVDKLGGGTRFDLQNINLLNKYIGMEKIDADSIPELKYMPMIAGVMIGFVVLAFLIDRFAVVALSTLVLVGISIAGMVDFFIWEYQYGHNLNPDAPIIVPGMTYQPPLIGCKQLLNITACSYPHYGGALLILGVTIMIYIVYSEYKRKENLA